MKVIFNQIDFKILIKIFRIYKFFDFYTSTITSIEIGFLSFGIDENEYVDQENQKIDIPKAFLVKLELSKYQEDHVHSFQNKQEDYDYCDRR